ncbi:MAG: response regulator [Deltaproteobacteria bacterium]|nr:response regulator [Deltaproteobacteria bacterium]
MDIYSKLKSMTILLVDDNEVIRGSMQFHFDSHGCRLKTVETGEEALKAIRQEKYDIVIVDYRLPGIDGLKFLELVQKSHPKTLKVLITAYGSKKVFAKAAKLGVHEFIEKPLTVNSLEESLRRLVNNKEYLSTQANNYSGLEQGSRCL